MTKAPRPVIILLNGPPKSGKDTAYTLLKSGVEEYLPQLRLARVAFADPIKKCVRDILGLDNYAEEFLEQKKDVRICDWLETRQDIMMTLREMYIDIAETYFKPKFGKDFFAITGLQTKCGELCYEQ
jgi:hypothetical protein